MIPGRGALAGRLLDPATWVALAIVSSSLAIYRYDVGPFQVSLLRLLLVPAGGLMALALLRRRPIRRDPILLALLALLGVKVASLLSPGVVLAAGYRSAFMFAEAVLVYFLVSQTMSGPREDRVHSLALMGALAVAAAGGAYQWYCNHYAPGVTAFPLQHFLRGSRFSQVVLFHYPDGRLTSFFADPNYFGGFLAVALLMLTPGLLYWLHERHRGGLAGWGLLGAAAVLLLGSQSRSALIALPIGGAVWLAASWWTGSLPVLVRAIPVPVRAILAAGLAVTLAGTFWLGGFERVINRLEAERQRAAVGSVASYREHARFIEEGWRYLSREPEASLVGVGEGNYAYRVLRVPTIGNAHNIFWAGFVEQGAFGLLTLILVCGVLAHAPLRALGQMARLAPARRSGVPRELADAPALGVALVVLFLVLANLYGHLVPPFLWIAFGMIRARLFRLESHLVRG